MSTRVARIVRGLLVAAVSLLVASISHLAGGGRIGGIGFVLAFVFSTLLSIALAGKSVSRIRVAVAVTASQAVFHLLFGVGAGPQSTGSAGSRGMTMPGMVMGDPLGAAHASAALSPVAPITIDAVPIDNWMWVAHALAALITTIALVMGERAFWALAEWVFYSLARAFTRLVPIIARQPVLPQGALTYEQQNAPFLLAGMRHRGPPRIVASH